MTHIIVLLSDTVFEFGDLIPEDTEYVAVTLGDDLDEEQQRWAVCQLMDTTADLVVSRT